MKWNELCKFFIISFLALALTSCSSPVRYECPAFSSVVLDKYTDKPVENARVQVSWTALRSRHELNFVEGSVDTVTLNAASAVTDKNGIYTIPAWETVVAGGLFDIGPNVSVADPKTKPNKELESELEYIDRSYENALSPSSPGFAFRTVRLEAPGWAISEEEVSKREKGIIFQKVTEDVLSNSLTFYDSYNKMVENGRFIDIGIPNFDKCYIRPTPDLVVINIQAFYTKPNLPQNMMYIDAQPIAIALLPTDAKKILTLENSGLRNGIIFCMLDNKPFGYYLDDGDPHSKIAFLFISKNQNLQEVEQALQKLVQSK